MVEDGPIETPAQGGDIPCRACGKSLDRAARVCLHCGHDIGKYGNDAPLKAWQWALLGAFVLALIVYMNWIVR